MLNAHATLTIDLAALAANYRMLAEKVSPAICAAVVKADAYGLGMLEVAPTLHKAGCRKFYVATEEEGVSLRSLLPTVDISVLHGPSSHRAAKSFFMHRLMPVVNSAEQLAWCREAGQALASPPRMTLHVDTGMHRLGFSHASPPELSTGFDAENITLMSHMACPDMPEHPLNAEQLVRVKGLREIYPGMACSLANSSGIFLGKDFWQDEVRPGAALYGINPTPHLPNPMQPAVTLLAPILQQRVVEEKGTAGYGATHKVKKGDRLAVAACGYADGLLRAASNNATCVLHHEGGQTPVPLVGRVSMDMVIVDVSAVPEAAITGESELEIIGAHATLDALADAAGTIGYEVLTRLGPRLKRRYVGK